MTVADVVAQTRDGRLEDFLREGEAVLLIARELMEAEMSEQIGRDIPNPRHPAPPDQKPRMRFGRLMARIARSMRLARASSWRARSESVAARYYVGLPHCPIDRVARALTWAAGVSPSPSRASISILRSPSRRVSKSRRSHRHRAQGSGFV
jgi:hypothetical protein